MSISFPSPAARRVLIVANPKAGSRSGSAAVARLVELLEADGFSAQVHHDVEAAAEESSKLLAAGELRCVVAAGGDGTVGLVVNKTAPGTPVAVLPLGTENLLAKHLGMPADPAEVLQVIRHGAGVQLDAGRAGGRLFLLMASCGFDAEVVRRLHSGRSGHIHHLSYAKPILDSIRSYNYPALRITCEGEASLPEDDMRSGSRETSAGRLPSSECRETSAADSFSEVSRLPLRSEADEPAAPLVCRWAFVMNLPRYAGGLQIVPQAVGDDGLLDVCTFKEGSLWSGLTYLAGVLMGQHQTYSDCVNRRTRSVRIESDEPVPYQLDGDPGGFTPLEIDVVPGRLTLLAPLAWARQHDLSHCESPA